MVKFYYCSWTNTYAVDESEILINFNDFSCAVIPSCSSDIKVRDVDWLKFLYSIFGD